MALNFNPSHLLNPLVTSIQLETSASRLDGVPKELEDALCFGTARLVQAAGVLLRLPQEIVGQAIVILFRFWTSPDGGSLLEHDSKDVAAASLYLVSKPSAHPVSPRQVITTTEFVSNLSPEQLVSDTTETKLDVVWLLTEGHYEAARERLYSIEFNILRVLGFQTHVALPHSLSIHYLQTLDVFHNDQGKALATRTLAHLNTALLSPQLLYLTHQPSALATSAIYLAAREMDVKLPEVEWWEAFDVDREELGFLVVALQSTTAFAYKQKQRWASQKIPFTVEALQKEIKRSWLLKSEA